MAAVLRSFVLVALVCSSSRVSGKNVLLMVADDGGFEMGTYLNDVVQTPNLDALAKKSLIFNRAYTTVSSCSPSRATILTGMPAHQNGMYGLHNGVHNFDALSSVKSLPTYLSRNQIVTGIVGKKHVGPQQVFPFDYAQTEEHHSILQVGRNVTNMKLLVREFLNSTKSKPFFLYVGFHDPHRCGHTHPEYGNFCERFGNGDTGMGVIPDWTPILYQPDQVKVPYHVQDTRAAREDIAAQYTTISRMDVGVGLVMAELAAAGVLDETLVIYTSDNGIPFPAGRTNLYDSGMAIPMFIRSPTPGARHNEITYFPTTLLDLAPTVLDWYGIPKPDSMSGKSLLNLFQQEPPESHRPVFGSHSLHEITMYYPMRAVRTRQFKLIHNLNYRMPFPIDQDFFLSPTFQDLLNSTRSKQATRWYRSLESYYFRPQWELYDLTRDPEEVTNVAKVQKYSGTLKKLKGLLQEWQVKTKDPWLCSPTGVLEQGQCFQLDNDIPSNCL